MQPARSSKGGSEASNVKLEIAVRLQEDYNDPWVSLTSREGD